MNRIYGYKILSVCGTEYKKRIIQPCYNLPYDILIYAIGMTMVSSMLTFFKEQPSRKLIPVCFHRKIRQAQPLEYGRRRIRETYRCIGPSYIHWAEAFDILPYAVCRYRDEVLMAHRDSTHWDSRTWISLALL